MKAVVLSLGVLLLLASSVLALTTEQVITPADVLKHPEQFSVKVTKNRHGLLAFTIKHNVARPMYHVAHLAIKRDGKLVATVDMPSFGKQRENTYHFSLRPADIEHTEFSLSDSHIVGVGENSVPVPGTIVHQFPLKEFVPKDLAPQNSSD